MENKEFDEFIKEFASLAKKANDTEDEKKRNKICDKMDKLYKGSYWGKSKCTSNL